MITKNSGRGFERVREAVDSHPMWHLFLYCLVYWRRLSGGVITAMITRLCRLVPPLVVAAAIDRIIAAPGQPGTLAQLGLLTKQTIPATDTAMRFTLLKHLAFIAIVAYLIRALTRFISRYLLQSTAQKVQRDLRNNAYRHMQTLSMQFYDNNETGGMMSILNNDINRLEQFLNTELNQIVRVCTIVLGIGGIMLYVSPKLAIIALIPVPLIGLASGSFLIWIDKKYRQIRGIVGRLNSRLANNLGGMKVIKAFNRYAYEEERVARESEEYHDQHVAAIKIRRAYFSFLRLSTGAVFVTLLYVGGTDTIQGDISLGTFTLFFLLLRRLYGPMRRIGRTANKYQLAKSSAERVFGLLGLDPELKTPVDPYTPDEVEGHVDFDNVSFSYHPGELVLEDVNLEVEAGETIGLVGETGAGKSTLLKLLPRFYDVQQGTLRIDEVDVRNYHLETLRDKIGIVDQDPYLFSGTVLENIAYGRGELLSQLSPESSTKTLREVKDHVQEAARAAEAHQFIENLPEGYKTQIGERGVKLSGGQRQRLSIARALLNDPAIIIFDEATSDVDTRTEVLIQKSLDVLCEQRTAFVIAHRLSTVKKADRIVVMEAGKIINLGTHTELMEEDGLYSSLWQAQAEKSTVL